uniref:Amine oxidase domain-containing protein n=1 Tax=viral metagenome TaxID=1070528 RepID=A0A6C0EUV4_9ZZZZ
MYDIAIIGGGISGLYCALKLNKKNNIVLFESDRIGGRIYTHTNPTYEIGAGRFNNSHKILVSLIKKYDLETYKMSPYADYIHKDHTISLIKDSQRYIDNCMKYILNTTTINEKLRTITFFAHCVNLLGNDNATILSYVYGYYSEFHILNAFDAIKLFDTYHIYYGLKNGMYSLCESILKDIRRLK